MQKKTININNKEFKYTIEPYFDMEGEACRVKCKALNMDMVYDLKYMPQDAIDGLHTFYENQRALQREGKKELKIWAKTYQVIFHYIGWKSDNNCRYRIVCKWAKYNTEHLSSDLEKVYNEILPNILSRKQKTQKTSPFQIRFTQEQKNKISLLAKKQWLSISDFILQKAFA